MMVPVFVVLTILLFVSIDAVVQARKRSAASVGPVPARPLRALTDGLAVPSGLFLHPGHTWLELQPSGSVRVGLDDFVNKAVGRIDRVKLLLSGSDSRVEQGQPMLEVEQAGKIVVLPSPVSGTVSASNRAVEARPGMLSEAPYQNWVYSIAPTRLGKEILSLKVAESATSWLKDEVDRFTQWLTNLGASQALPALADGGLPTVGVLGDLPSTEWQAFQEQFLSAGHEQQA